MNYVAKDMQIDHRAYKNAIAIIKVVLLGLIKLTKQTVRSVAEIHIKTVGKRDDGLQCSGNQLKHRHKSPTREMATSILRAESE